MMQLKRADGQTINRQSPTRRGRYWIMHELGAEEYGVEAECNSYDVACEQVEHGLYEGRIIYDPIADTATEFRGGQWHKLWSEDWRGLHDRSDSVQGGVSR